MRRITKYAVAIGALLVAFVVGRSQALPTWQVLNKEGLQDGLSIMETLNTQTGETYVVVWSSAGIAIAPKALPAGPALAPPVH